MKKKLSGWSEYKHYQCEIFTPNNIVELQNFIKKNKKNKKVIARGHGCSNGDQSILLDGVVVDINNLNKIINYNKQAKTIEVEAGVKLSDILTLTLKDDLFFQSIPGGLDITIGGAISNNVHGKDCFKNGYFNANVNKIKILRSDGEIVEVSNKTNKAEFIYQNLSIQNNLIHSAYLSGVKELIFLGSSCVYPKKCKQPIKEDYLLTGLLEETNDAYAIAKIAGIKMCKSYNEQYKTNYKCLMPTNTYGPNDNYHPINSHFLPAIIRKIDLVKKNKSKYLLLWGNGKVKRELIYVDDLASACLYFMKKKVKEDVINIGTGKDYSINFIARQILKILIPNKKIFIKYDKSKPNGTLRKVLDISLAKSYGWKARTNFRNSILETYKAYKMSLLK